MTLSLTPVCIGVRDKVDRAVARAPTRNPRAAAQSVSFASSAGLATRPLYSAPACSCSGSLGVSELAQRAEEFEEVAG
jgi:hypothetical protein